MKSHYKVEISTNLWIPLSSHIYIHRQKKTPTHIIFDGTSRSPFYTSTKRGRSENRNKRAVIGHFQKVGLVGKLMPGCLVCCQTLDNLIKDLIN